MLGAVFVACLGVYFLLLAWSPTEPGWLYWVTGFAAITVLVVCFSIEEVGARRLLIRAMGRERGEKMATGLSGSGVGFGMVVFLILVFLPNPVIHLIPALGLCFLLGSAYLATRTVLAVYFPWTGEP